MDKMPEMAIPKKVIVFNPETNKRETWSWTQFQKHIALFTQMFEDAGIDPADLVATDEERDRAGRAKYDH